MLVSSVTGVVLAGGKSARMGADKASMVVQGKQMAAFAVDVLRQVVSDVVIVTKEPGKIEVEGARTVADAVPGHGPLVGIYTALLSSHTPYCFVVACDMPFVDPALIKHMVARCEDHDVVVPKIGTNFEPLFALYSKNCAPVIKESLDKEDYRVRNVFSRLRVLEVDEEEIRSIDPDLRSFTNINTKDDLEGHLGKKS